jgi:hypothetical protein
LKIFSFKKFFEMNNKIRFQKIKKIKIKFFPQPRGEQHLLRGGEVHRAEVAGAPAQAPVRRALLHHLLVVVVEGAAGHALATVDQWGGWGRGEHYNL